MMNSWMDAESRVDRARELYDQGRLAEAAAELRSAIEINPYNPMWHFNLGLTLEALAEYVRACKAYKAALKLSPHDAETLNCLGVNMTRLGRYGDALECFAKIEQIDPTYEAAYCNRIVTYTEMGDHEQAELMFHMARLFKEECPLCYYNVGNSLYARGQYDHAIHCWRETLRIDPAHAQANARVAEALWSKGQLAGARRHYELELDVSGDDVHTLLDFGELLLEMEDAESAEKMFHRALAQAPDSTAAHFCLGELAMRRSQLDLAEEQFLAVLMIDPDFSGAHNKIAQIFIRKGKVQEAAKHLLDEMKKCGQDPVVLRELGQLLIEVHQTHHANTILRRLVEIQPDDPHAQHNLAISFFMLDELDDGIRHCRKALKLKPEYPLALYNMALAHLRIGQVKRARRYAARALTMAPRNKHIIRLSRQLGMTGLWSKFRQRFHRPSRDDFE